MILWGQFQHVSRGYALDVRIYHQHWPLIVRLYDQYQHLCTEKSCKTRWFESLIVRTPDHKNSWSYEPVIVRTPDCKNPWMQEPLIVRLLIVRTLKCKAQIWNLWFESVDLNPQNVTAEPKKQIITPDFKVRIERPRDLRQDPYKMWIEHGTLKIKYTFRTVSFNTNLWSGLKLSTHSLRV